MVNEQTKRCSSCKYVLPVDEFYTIRHRGKKILQSLCKTCSTAHATEWRRKKMAQIYSDPAAHDAFKKADRKRQQAYRTAKRTQVKS